MRRRAFLDAAMEQIARDGVGALGVRSVCRQAHLTDRYFYESFRSLDELIGDVYDSVLDEAYAEIVEAISKSEPGIAGVEAAIRAYCEFLIDDPRRARVFLLEADSSTSISSHLRRKAERNRGLFIGLLRTVVDPDVDPKELELKASALAGSQTRLFIDWLSGTLDVDKERFIQHTFAIFKAVAAARP